MSYEYERRIGTGFQMTCKIPKSLKINTLSAVACKIMLSFLISPQPLKHQITGNIKAIFAITTFVWKDRSRTNLCLNDKFSKLLARHVKNKLWSYIDIAVQHGLKVLWWNLWHLVNKIHQEAPDSVVSSHFARLSTRKTHFSIKWNSKFMAQKEK